MTDDIRQEAVERLKRSMPMMGRSICADIEYLIDQLTEAIAQRDEAERQASTLAEQFDEAANLASDWCDQLAEEREMCDRARPLVAGGQFWMGSADWIAEYDAHRVAEGGVVSDDATNLDARREVARLREQLAAERAQCDRAADYIRHQPARDVVWRDGWLRDYDAHRAAERSDG